MPLNRTVSRILAPPLAVAGVCIALLPARAQSPKAEKPPTTAGTVAAAPDRPRLVDGWIGIGVVVALGYAAYRKFRASGVDPKAVIGRFVVDDATQAPARGAAAQSPAPPPLDDLPAPSSRAPTSSAPSAPARLVATGGPLLGKSARLVDPFVLGRAPGCSLVLDEESVSREHAAIHHSDAAGWVVSDRNSANGTWLNGRRIDQPTALRPGDTLQVGSSRFRFEGGA